MTLLPSPPADKHQIKHTDIINIPLKESSQNFPRDFAQRCCILPPQTILVPCCTSKKHHNHHCHSRSPVALFQKYKYTPLSNIINRILQCFIANSPTFYSFGNGLRQPFFWGRPWSTPKTSQEQDYVKYPPHYLKEQNSHKEELPSHKLPIKQIRFPDKRRQVTLNFVKNDFPPHAPQRYHKCTSKLNINNQYFHSVNNSNHPIPRPSTSPTPAATSPQHPPLFQGIRH